MAKNVSQNDLAKQLSRFLDLQGQLSHEVTNRLREGCCHGYSVMHSLMAASGHLDDWQKLLTEIANWDGTETALFTEAHFSIPHFHKKKFPTGQLTRDFPKNTLGAYFESGLLYILYWQAQEPPIHPEWYENVTGNLSLQKTMLHPNGPLVTEKDPIKKHIVAAGCFSITALFQLLQTKIFSKPETLFLVSSFDHATAIRFEPNKKKWLLFNSNHDVKEEISCYTKLGLILAIRYWSVFGALEINIATWRNDLDFSDFEKAYQQQLENDAPALIARNGLHIIARSDPDTLSKLLTRSEHHPDLIKAIAMALTVQTKDGSTGWHMTAQHAPAAIPQLLALSEHHPDLIKAIAMALTVQTQDSWTGWSMTARYAPAAIPQLLALSEHHPDLIKAIAMALTVRNNNGYTGLETMIENAPVDALFKLFILCQKNAALKDAVSSAFNATHPDACNYFLINYILLLHIVSGVSLYLLFAPTKHYFPKNTKKHFTHSSEETNALILIQSEIPVTTHHHIHFIPCLLQQRKLMMRSVACFWKNRPTLRQESLIPYTPPCTAITQWKPPCFFGGGLTLFSRCRILANTMPQRVLRL